jgi:guanylate kinase
VALKKNNLSGFVFVVSGPSGSGKTTLLKRLFQDRQLRKILAKSVSYTTRPARSKERSGRDYFFVREDEFEGLRRAKKFLEWTRYLGYYYATSKEFIENQLARSRNIVLCLDQKGARSMKRLYPGNAVTIFIAPPSVRVLQERIAKRCCKTKAEEIRQRLELAQKEVRQRCQHDHCLVNKDLARTVEALKQIIVNRISKRGEG